MNMIDEYWLKVMENDEWQATHPDVREDDDEDDEQEVEE